MEWKRSVWIVRMGVERGGEELKYEKEGVYGINLREDEDGNLSERKICVSNNINSRIYRIYASE